MNPWSERLEERLEDLDKIADRLAFELGLEINTCSSAGDLTRLVLNELLRRAMTSAAPPTAVKGVG
jgi:signal transduction protein with GAF and PtsI domain